MTTDKFIPSFLLLSALAMPLVGCSGGDDDDDNESSTPPAATDEPTPTATATAEPTPTATAIPPFDKWQAFTLFQIADEDEGLDYDGQGSAHDNGLYAAFVVIQETLIENVNLAIDGRTDTEGYDPCEATTAGCLSEAQARAAKAAAKQTIEAAVSIENINANLEENYGADGSPQAINIKEEGSDWGLYYHLGNGDTTSWTSAAEIGVQIGTLDQDGGESSFGPGSFAFTIGEGEDAPTFLIKDALTVFTYNASGINNALTGGGIEIVALLNLVSPILDALVTAELITQEEADVILGDAETNLTAASDIICTSSSNPCFSVTFSYNSAPTTVN